MRVFVTGASGYIGLSVAVAFSRSGHHVLGMIRNSSKSDLLKAHEIEPVVGNMQNLDSYKDAALSAEVLVHCAFELSPQASKLDFATVESLINVAKQQKNLPRAILYTSGVWVHGNTQGCVDESCPLNPIDIVKWRPAQEQLVLEAASSTLRTVVIRPGCVYGGMGSLTNLWFQSDASNPVTIIDEGKNHWAMIHVQDLAEAYVLAAEKELSGLALNVTDGTHFTVKEMAQAAAQVTGAAVNSISRNEAEKKWGPLTQGLAIDQKISNGRARRLLGWAPRHTSFIEGVRLYQASSSAIQALLKV